LPAICVGDTRATSAACRACVAQAETKTVRKVAQSVKAARVIARHSGKSRRE